MALRAAILSAAIKEIPSLSFTRAALSAGFSSIPPTVVSSLSPSTLDPTARDAVIDTLFGSDSSASRALVEAWEAYGANEMSGVGTGSPKDRVRSALSKRLEWSAGVGEHLVEAYALLSTASAPSVPVPPAVLKTLEALRALRVPKYTPPALVARAAGTVASRHAESVLEETGDRLPLPTINPLAPLAYGWRIADTAVYAASPDKGRVGVMREPLGAGVEWYTGRVGLAAAYLSAEAYLLQPYPESTIIDASTQGTSTNPYLPEALAALDRNLQRYDDARGTLGAVENGTNGLISLLEEATRSVAGIIRSRGF